jgi:hypothetical protein
MKLKLIILWLMTAMAALGADLLGQFPMMRFTVHVIGEDGQPIPGVNATFMFNEAAVGFGKLTEVSAITDNNGTFTVEGYSENGVIGTKTHGLNKDGYYDGGVNAGHPFYTIKDGHWLPWGQTYTTVLRRVGTPIPLYARKVGIGVPASGTPVGYDLEEGDWVAPYGSGKVTDLLVTVTNLQYRSNNDSDVSATISFPNDGDGIQEVKLPEEFANSMFIWPREAPVTGYQSKLEARRLWLNTQAGKTQNITTSNENQAHFFRVRTVKQGDQIVSGIYGKIKGGIGIGPGDGKSAAIGFTYYLNPTPNDRNLEFSGNTLFKNLTRHETTHVP